MTEKTTWSGGLFAIALMACALHLPSASAGDGGQHWWEEHQNTSNPPSNRPPTQPPAASLEGVLGIGADQSWTVANGNYTINHVTSIPVAMRHAAGRNDTGWDVFKVEDGPEVVLDGRNQYPTGIEVTGWVRLSRTGSYIRMRVARHQPPIDPKDPAKPPSGKISSVVAPHQYSLRQRMVRTGSGWRRPLSTARRCGPKATGRTQSLRRVSPICREPMCISCQAGPRRSARGSSRTWRRCPPSMTAGTACGSN